MDKWRAHPKVGREEGVAMPAVLVGGEDEPVQGWKSDGKLAGDVANALGALVITKVSEQSLSVRWLDPDPVASTFLDPGPSSCEAGKLVLPRAAVCKAGVDADWDRDRKSVV